MNRRVGKVYLVGGGPGDPGLLSLRGRDCLALADVVLYDGLVNPALLKHTQASCERTSRSGEGSGRRLNQEEINAKLVELGLAGKTVVRLKGGDPYIFGRGSEEALALQQAGIPFEVVPGVTAATAAGAYAGFSLTHRDHASAVAFVTGHEDPTKPSSSLDYEALANFPGTLVFYMGLHRLRTIADSLIAAGKSPATPAAVVSHASRRSQRSVVANLVDLPERAKSEQLVAPSLIVVGDCVALREEINWFETLPLFRKTIGVTRPIEHASDSSDQVVHRGGEPLLMPSIEIDIPAKCPDLADALKSIETIDVIALTSQFAVHSLFRQIDQLGRDARMLGGTKLACIGDSTASVLDHEYRLVPDLVASTSEASAFAEEIHNTFHPDRVLWPKSSRGRDALTSTLKSLGVDVVEAVAYENRDLNSWSDDVLAQLHDGLVDWITITSPSTAKQVAALLPDNVVCPRIAAISPLTAQAAVDAGLDVSAVAKRTSFESLLDAIAEADTIA